MSAQAIRVVGCTINYRHVFRSFAPPGRLLRLSGQRIGRSAGVSLRIIHTSVGPQRPATDPPKARVLYMAPNRSIRPYLTGAIHLLIGSTS